MTDDTAEPPEGAAPRPADRTLTWYPFAGAAAVALLVGAIIFFVGAGDNNTVGAKTDSAGALVCPGDYMRTSGNGDDRVPADPSGVAGGGALVPDAKPTHVTLCRYGPPDGVAGPNAQVPLDGHVTLASGLAAATRQLHGAARATGSVTCTAQRTTDRTAYLVGFTFATGVLWVSVPGDDCARTSNGQFSTTTDFHAPIASAFTTRAWPTA